MVFSSTAAVYGMPEEKVISEDMPLAPINPYGASKMMSEQMIRDLSAASDLNHVILRYFNVAGADITSRLGQATPEATHLIKVACECVTGERDGMVIFGTDYETRDGTCIRDYIHVDDLAKAHVMALDYMAKGGESQILNCGYGRGFTVSEVIDTVKEKSGQDFPVENVDRRAGDPDALMANNAKIKAVLGWEPDHDDLGVIVKSALDWEAKWQKQKAESAGA
ncbi:UDP-glucose 4-epimerase GalE, partial [Oleiphilus sp. HI0123]